MTEGRSSDDEGTVLQVGSAPEDGSHRDRPPADSMPGMVFDAAPPSSTGRPATSAPIVPALLATAAVTAAAAATAAFAWRLEHAGQPMQWVSFGGLYAVLLVMTVVYLAKTSRLDALKPRGGDLSFGALVAVGTYLVAVVLRTTVLDGAPGLSWLIRTYAQLGELREIYVGPSVLLVAAATEIVWRGGIQTALVDAPGPTRGWQVATVAFAAAQAPSLWLLSAVGTGPNPLLVALALGGGGVWGLIALKTQRLGISVAAHALFVWAVTQYPVTLIG
ncbi:MAG: type II CAAX endopeptidase family protein [Myxococcota bacterium]